MDIQRVIDALDNLLIALDQPPVSKMIGGLDQLLANVPEDKRDVVLNQVNSQMAMALKTQFEKGLNVFNDTLKDPSILEKIKEQVATK